MKIIIIANNNEQGDSAYLEDLTNNANALTLGELLDEFCLEYELENEEDFYAPIVSKNGFYYSQVRSSTEEVYI